MAAAVPDLARLLTLFSYPHDTYPVCLSPPTTNGFFPYTICPGSSPIIKRNTILQYLNAAVTTVQKPGATRAGYGWDNAALNSDGTFYAQKGGSLSTTNNGVQINEDWGLVINWGGKPTGAPADWYPDFPEVMNAATSYFTDQSPDLFPSYGIYHLP